jgi:hypothetical protein
MDHTARWQILERRILGGRTKKQYQKVQHYTNHLQVKANATRQESPVRTEATGKIFRNHGYGGTNSQ